MPGPHAGAMPPRPPAPPAAPAQRIDPNSIPRPRYTDPAHPIRYPTSGEGFHAPPHAWLDFVAEDCGNANPRYLRSTLYQVPLSKDILKETHVPMAVAVMPMAGPAAGEQPLQVVDMGEAGPPRCTRCGGYINPFAKWTDGGRAWSCNLCGMLNEAPVWYQGGVDQYGLRRDRLQRPELCLGSVEFAAPASYLLRPPQPLAIAFVIDVSFQAVASGALAAAAAAISAALQFYNCSPGRSEPLQAIAGDVDDAFCPLPPDQWCPPLGASRAHVEALLDRLPALFPATAARALQSCAGAAVKAAVDGLQHAGGRVVLFQCQLPTCGEGRLAPREAARVYGTEKEREMFTPGPANAGAWYLDMAKSAAQKGVCVDIFVCTSTFVDLGNSQILASMTGGGVQLYPGFPAPHAPPASLAAGPVPIAPVAPELQDQLAHEVRALRHSRLAASMLAGVPCVCALFYAPCYPAMLFVVFHVLLASRFLLSCSALQLHSLLVRDFGSEVMLKVRTSPGLRVTKYWGNFFEREDGVADMGGVDAEKCVIAQMVSSHAA
jgi:protein transport protein SEC24